MIEHDGARNKVIPMYERWLRDERPHLMAALPELRVKDLACCCAPLACHGDVLLRLANATGNGLIEDSAASKGGRQPIA
jgi:hypothetical protein